MKDKSLWTTIIGQNDAIDKITNSLTAGQNNHAWLFAGPRGVGKWTTAKVLAAALNCANQGCGKCVSCNKILREVHPDIHTVEPEGNFILIEQIEEILHKVNLKNFEGFNKVVIIDEADQMTPEAANSLLKTLEEPPANVVFILITANFEAMLPTIVSRCRVIQFRALQSDVIAKYLVEKFDSSYENALLATRLSGGILGQAISFISSPAKIERRKQVLKNIQALDRLDLARVSLMAEDLLREIDRPVEELKSQHKKEINELKKLFEQTNIPQKIKSRIEQRQKREISREKNQGYMDILNIMASWYRDIALFKETQREDILTNLDQVLIIKEHADVLSSKDIFSTLEVIEKTRQYLRFNVNIQLAIETMLIKIHDIIAIQQDISYF